MFVHVWKASNHMVLFRIFLLLTEYLTQFWTVKLLIHKPQPRPIQSFKWKSHIYHDGTQKSKRSLMEAFLSYVSVFRVQMLLPRIMCVISSNFHN